VQKRLEDVIILHFTDTQESVQDKERQIGTW